MLLPFCRPNHLLCKVRKGNGVCISKILHTLPRLILSQIALFRSTVTHERTKSPKHPSTILVEPPSRTPGARRGRTISHAISSTSRRRILPVKRNSSISDFPRRSRSLIQSHDGRTPGGSRSSCSRSRHCRNQCHAATNAGHDNLCLQCQHTTKEAGDPSLRQTTYRHLDPANRIGVRKRKHHRRKREIRPSGIQDRSRRRSKDQRVPLRRKYRGAMATVHQLPERTIRQNEGANGRIHHRRHVTRRQKTKPTPRRHQRQSRNNHPRRRHEGDGHSPAPAGGP